MGYPALNARAANSDARQTGLWKTDLVSGERRLLLSLAEVLAHWAMPTDGLGHFLTHPSVSADGSKIVFLHRFFAQDGGSYTRLMCCNSDGKELVELADEKVSHFDWLDTETLLVWARLGGRNLAQMRVQGVFNHPAVKPIINIRQALQRALEEAFARRILFCDFNSRTREQTQAGLAGAGSGWSPDGRARP